MYCSKDVFLRAKNNQIYPNLLNTVNQVDHIHNQGYKLVAHSLLLHVQHRKSAGTALLL